MKILLLAPGKSIHTHKWANYYLSQGHEVKVVSFPDHYSEEHAKEVDTEILPKLLPGKLSYFSSVFALKKILASFKPDIFHAHYVSSYGFVGSLANYHPFYISVWGRDIYTFPAQNKLNQKIVEFALRKADVICSTSHVMAEETKKYTTKSIEVTPFGVDLTKFKPMPQQTDSSNITIGTVKALEDKYGIGDLIRAFGIVHQQHQNARLLIVGEGKQKEEYETLVKELGLSEVTVFTGRIPNYEVPDYINQMDIFAVPSTENSESFGVAAVEAQACGTSVVVSNVGGLPEVVKDGVTGLVVPKNNETKLAEAFKTLMDNEALREQMGANGVTHVKENYNWLDNAESMIGLYKKTLERKR